MEYLDINAIVNECLCTVVDKKLFILLFCNLWYLNVGIIIVFRGMRRLAIFLTIDIKEVPQANDVHRLVRLVCLQVKGFTKRW